ncbi:MAG: homocysteine S-methyltransferase family protein [bacterium]|nr:MAG: homocysteine S-methyltransferase family protein [bacterium]
MNSFRNALKERTLLCDGAMGTMLQAGSLKPGQCPEAINLDHPGEVDAVHRAYLDAGVDIIETNTFGGSRVKLASFGLAGKTEKINAAAVRVAKEAARDRAFVAGSVGPTGRFLPPVGDLEFEEALDIFSQQIGAMVNAGADLIIFETFTDIKELRAGVIAARSLGDIPIVALMTFEPNGATLLGGSPEASAVTLEALGVDALGANCSLGPEGILSVLSRMASVTELPLVALPNAGMPRLEEGRTIFPATPDEVAGFTEDFLGLGTGILGGCCGTTPEHIARLRGKLDGLASRSARYLTDPGATRLSARGQVLFLGGNSSLRTIGERLNPTGRKALAEAVRSGKLDLYREEARRQVEAGAQMLDVNVGVPGVDETHAMRKAVLAVQQGAAVPLSIDSPKPEVIEAGLKAADGKVLINSVTGEKDSLDAVLPMAARYGAAVLGLTLDETGIPHRAEDRLNIARRILDAAVRSGIPASDLVIDCLTLAAGAEQETVRETLAALRMVREELGLNTVLGVSNVSFGLPARENLNAAFLAMAASAGLSAAIINPFHETSMGIVSASRVILNQDVQARDYIRLYSPVEQEQGGEAKGEGMSSEEALRKAVIEGDPEGAGQLAKKLLEGGTAPMELGETILIPAMSVVGERFASNQYFLPQVLMSAKAMKAAFEPVRERLKAEDVASRGKILMATVEGDVHDIGKNIVITLLENHGFTVVDLGKNVPAEEIVRQAELEKCDAVGLSALMTTTMVKMKEAIQAMRGAGLEMPVVVGGAAVTAEFASEIGADGYAADATAAVTRFLELLGAHGGS